MNSDRDRILSEFIDAWNAGRRPDVEDALAAVPESERDELADDLATFLTLAPAPDYDEATLEAIAAEPAVAAALAASAGRAGLWPELLPRLRERARMSTAQLASKLVAALGLSSDSEPKTAEYLEQMESGSLEPTGVSRRVLDALSRVLPISMSDLEGAADAGLGLRYTAPAALFRADKRSAEAVHEHLDVLADAFAAPGGEDWDEVDELFRGGR